MSKQNALRLRAKMIRKGVSLRQWAIKNGYNVDSVYKALKGTRKGPISTKILAELKNE